jgi:glyoxylase-like metal-dependent hydrolase (beta-lactamase superfamily II)
MLKHYEIQGVHYWQTARNYFGRNLYITGFYLVDRTLIDCGPPNVLPLLKPLFRDLPLKNVLITHHHEDHTGNLNYLKTTYGITAWAHPKTSSSLDLVVREIPLYRRIVWGRPEPAEMSTIPAEIETEKRGLQIIETPGHSEDHICLFDPERRWIFTGDLYLSSYLRYLRNDENIYEIMDSLQKLIQLRPVLLFCNHRGPVENAEEALTKKLSFLERLRDEVLGSTEKGISVETIAATKFKRDVFFRSFSRGELSTVNLLQSFLKYRK